MNLISTTKTEPVNEALAVEQHFKKFHTEFYKATCPNQLDFLEQHLFFITVMFRSGHVSICEMKSELCTPKIHPMNAFSIHYYNVMKQIMGNNLHRKRRWQPLTYAWVDFENSRLGQRIDPGQASNPHIHALALCHPNQRVKFPVFLNDHVLRRAMGIIESLKVRNFDSSIKPLKDLISYCSKGYDNINLKNDDNTKIKLRALLPK